MPPHPTHRGSKLVEGRESSCRCPDAIQPQIPELQWTEIRRLNHRTLESLNQKGLLQERPDSDYQHIVDRWQFPLFTLDLSLLRVDIESLRERQRRWSPNW